MDKEQCVVKLNESGFAAKVENGVVMIEVRSEAERSRANRAVKEMGLRGSWGTRGVIDDGNSNRHSPEDEQSSSQA